jgi:hypothetical protein
MTKVYVPSRETIESRITNQMCDGGCKKRHFGGNTYYLYTSYIYGLKDIEHNSKGLAYEMSKHIRGRGFPAKVVDTGRAYEVWVARK